jgi:hypothetical protein
MRILYLEPGHDFAGIMQHLPDRWTADLALPPLDLAESHPQKSERSQIIITNALHFGAFDKSDEAMLNDYEELMGLLRTGEPVALDFSDIVLSFLSKDPASLEKPVEQEWSDTAVDGRLVFASPVPLNEEQRKILAALHRESCRFLAIEGPPGCGKSHTIVAIVFEAILTGRNVLVLSDNIGAKIVLYEDGTAAVSVFLIEADGEQKFLSYQNAADRKAAEAVVRARAGDNDIGADNIEIRYDDTRSVSRDTRRPIPGKAN